MKRGSRLLCCGTESGQVSLLDMNTFQVIKKLPAHAGRIADLDTQNNILLTCGFSPRYFRKKPLLVYNDNGLPLTAEFSTFYLADSITA